MLMPRKVKHRKQHHPGRSGMAKGGTSVAFGEFGNLLGKPGRVLDHARVSADLHDRVVPGRDDFVRLALGFVPGGGNVAVDALKHDQGCGGGGKQTPLRIGARNMRPQPSVGSDSWIKQERDRIGDRSLISVRDQEAKRARPYQPVQDVEAFFDEVRGLIHWQRFRYFRRFGRGSASSPARRRSR